MGIIYKILLPLSLGLAAYWLQFALKTTGVVPANLLKGTTQEISIKCAAAASMTAIPMLLSVLLFRMFTTANNSLGKDTEGKLAKVCIMALQNTFEQLFIFALNILALGTYAEVKAETLVIFTAGFVVARGAFWFGYIVGAYTGLPLRAPGFAINITSNLCLCVYNICALTGHPNALINLVSSF